MLGDKGLERGGIAAHQGWRAALREQQRRQFLVEVTQALRVVHHQCALRLGQAEDLGVVQVIGVDRGILAHQHHLARPELEP